MRRARNSSIVLLLAIPVPTQDPGLGELTRQLADREAGVRKRAAEAIGKLGANALPAAPALAVALADKESAVADACASALGAIGKKAIPTIRKALPDRDRQQHAVKAVGALGADGAEFVPELLKLLRQEDFQLREPISKAVVAIGAPAVPHLIKALKERGLCADAASLLGDLRAVAKPAMPDLMTLAENRTELAAARSNALNALNALGADAAAVVPRILKLARGEKESSVRVNALRAVAAIGVKDPSDKQVLDLLAKDPDPEVAKAARDAIK